MNNIAIWISSLALTVSFLSLIIAFWRYRIASQTLAIAERQLGAKRPDILPYLIEGFIFRLDVRNSTVYAFSVTLSNRSDNDNSLAALDLRTTFVRADHTLGEFLLRHDNELKDIVELPGAPPLSIPRNIGAHQTIAGWALFEINNSLLGDRNIEGYRILFHDSHGLETHLDSILLQEMEA